MYIKEIKSEKGERNNNIKWEWDYVFQCEQIL